MVLIGLVLVLGVVFGWAAIRRPPREVVPSFEQQACALDPEWLLRTRRGYFEPRSGQIALLPRTPAYMASGAGGWSHSGPWPYLQEVPLVFYGPGIIEEGVTSDRPVTTADIAPTIAGLLKGRLGESEGQAGQAPTGDGQRDANDDPVHASLQSRSLYVIDRQRAASVTRVSLARQPRARSNSHILALFLALGQRDA